MPTNLLYVPTNRPCADQISELAREALLIGTDGRSCVLALIEHSDAPWVDQHRKTLAEQRKSQGVKVIHLTAGVAGNFLRTVINRLDLPSADSNRLLALLNPDELAYGAGPNKAALLAAALGCDTLHRRDSDVRVDEWSTGKAYPCVPELQALGRKIADLGLTLQPNGARNPDPSKTVNFVGTSSFGNSPHDRRDLLLAGEHFLVELELLAAPDESPDHLLEELRQYLTVDPGIRYTTDFAELDLTARTVMLSCAMKDVFLELPEMPIHRTLGTDYLRRNLLRNLHYPIIFHSRKVHHRYDDDRAKQVNPSAVNDYAQRDLRHLILWPILTRHHETLRRAPNSFLTPDGKLNSEQYAANLLDVLEDVVPVIKELPERFVSIYRAAARTVGDKQVAARLYGVADAVEAGPDYVGEVAQGVEDYCFLVRHWRALIESAATLDTKDLYV
ncbi:DUF6271 family protein [Amycolatopsis pithecellobii]|uniref:Uncharacterized protein n=1 Tax=Amycolatopsis pithecellobii TaxID=664692 RepID=A0A6N7YRD6_9PSEU|nr:DUF6271 family protein [Amycolatopsis pithecellobii]MTD55585.1 hypothetical protein [Amycolatopsis pithecellobii]